MCVDHPTGNGENSLKQEGDMLKLIDLGATTRLQAEINTDAVGMKCDILNTNMQNGWTKGQHLILIK